MAEGFLKSFDQNLEVHSAGTQPAAQIHPNTVQVMQEVRIDVSRNRPKPVTQFLNDNFDYLITVCDSARESCPVFLGQVKHQLHIGFEDPAASKGTPKEILAVYRRVRDEIQEAFARFYKQIRQSPNRHISFKIQ
jgi:arsenate reductase